MQPLQTKLIAIAAVSILAVIGSLMNSRQAAAAAASAPTIPAAAPVNIVGPLPVPVTGSVSGTVAATQSGAWTVGITGAPLVHLDSGASVTVPNSTTPGINAVQVRDVSQARQPVRAICNVQINAACHVYDVPANKILVVEYMSATCNVAAGQAIAVALSSFGPDVDSIWSSASLPAPAGSATFAAIGQQVTAYYTPAGNIYVLAVGTDGSSTATCREALWGHLVDIP